MSKYLYPIPFNKEIIKESKETALINELSSELEKNLGTEIVNKKWPKDLRAEPELLQILSIWRRKNIYLDGSPTTHKKIINSLYANDFLVPIGTPIQAIADWRIISLQEDFDEYGIGEEYGDKGNYITLRHANDKISQYIHLQQFSVADQKLWKMYEVKKGQIIWYTWASWRMDLPHLHFAFYQDKLGTWENIPLFYPNSNSNSKIWNIPID